MTMERISSAVKNSKKSGLMIATLALGLGTAGAVLTSNIPAAHAQLTDNKRIAELGNAPMSFADLVEQVRPAVVSIYVTGTVRPKAGKRSKRRGRPDGHPLDKFFKKRGKEFGGGVPSARPMRAQGSGFIISPDGYVVTNHHVVRNADNIKIAINGGKRLDAKLIGSDQRTDIALLKIKKPGTYQSVRFATKEARVGDWVLAIGNPFGLASTVTAGIVSARGRDVGESPYDFIQIDAAVNKGNSGGPTFNLNGNVVGVNTSIISPSGGNVGIAFAVPAPLVQDVVAQLKKTGTVSRGWLGVQIQSVSQDIADALGLKDPSGALVSVLTKNAPAQKSGMMVGDLILEVDGAKVKDSRDLARKIASLAPNSKTDLTIFRLGREQNLQVKLGRFPGSKSLASLFKGEERQKELAGLGLTLAPVGENAKGSKRGVLIQNVDQKSIAAEKGFRRGDIILGVNGRPVSSPAEVVKAVKAAKNMGRQFIMVMVRSKKRDAFVALPLKRKERG